MAVIRQRQQVFSKPIGVTRMDTGEADLWRTVKAGADQLTSIAFREGQTIAEETGREAALDLDISKINGVNPETGMSEPLSAPQGFGSIARRAYEKVVDARFMDDAQDRLELKAKELGSKYSRNPEEFSKQMSNFIAETADKTAEGKYRSTIVESGQKFLSDMQINLLDQQRSRARARETDFANYRAFQYGERIGEIAASGDFKGASREYFKGVAQADRIETAGMNGRKETEIHRQNYSTSLANGAVEHIITGLKNDVSRRSFLLYLETKGKQGKLIGYAKERKADIDKYLIGKQSFLDANNMRDVIVYGTGLGNAATQLDNAKIAQSQAQSDLFWKSETIARDLSTSDMLDSMGYRVSGALFQSITNAELDPMLPEAQGYNAIQGVARLTNEKLSQEVVRAEQRRVADPSYTNPEKLADVKNLRQRALDSFVLLGISEGNSDKFFNALTTGEHLGISETQIAVVEALRTNLDLFNRFEDVDYVSTFINKNKGSVREEIAKRDLAWRASSLGRTAIENAANSSWEESYAELKSIGAELGIVEGAVSYPVYQDQLDKYNIAWAKSRVDLGMSRNITPQELTALELYVRDNVKPDGTTDLVQSIYDNIDKITGRSLDRTTITNHIQSLNSDLVKNINDLAEQKEIQSNIRTSVQPSDPAASKKVSVGLDSAIAKSVFNIDLPDVDVQELIRQSLLVADSLIAPSVMTDPMSLDETITGPQNSNPTLVGAMVYEQAELGVISNSLVKLLNDLADGGINRDSEAITVMNHFSNLTTSVGKSGEQVNVLAKFTDEIGNDVMSRLTAVDLVSKIVGTEKIPSILAAIVDNQSDRDFNQIMKDEFGNGFRFISDNLGVENFSGEAKEALSATATYLYLATKGDKKVVAKQLKELYEQKFQETKGLVVDSAQTKQNRSMYAIHQIFPNERERSAFLNEVQSKLSIAQHPDYNRGYTLGSGSGGGIKPTSVLESAVGLVAPFRLQGYNIASGGVTYEAGEAFLHPLPKSSDRVVYYMAMEMDNTGGKKPIKLNGELMIFSNQEPYLQQLRETINQERDLRNKEILASRKSRQEITQEAKEQGALASEVQDILGNVIGVQN